MVAAMDMPRTRRPIVVAPMAGGPSTPELVVAAGEAGALGMLAGGYKTPADVVAEIAAVQNRFEGPFGVNLFVPSGASFAPQADSGALVAPGGDGADRDRADRAAVEAFRELLLQEAPPDVHVPTPDWNDTDHYEDKLDVVEAARVALVSFTFGCPAPHVVERLHAAGICVVVTVTSPAEARASVSAGADALVVQGYEAGGHRGTHRVTDTPEEFDHLALLPMLADVGVPLVAAGGITTAGDTRRALAAGAVAVQAGTAFLLADEAGTNAAYRMGLTAPRLRACVTRAFSGRPARALRNGFVERYDALAPAVYPAVDQLTKPLRARAAREGDLDGVSIWAGAGWRAAREAPAADIVAALTP